MAEGICRMPVRLKCCKVWSTTTGLADHLLIHLNQLQTTAAARIFAASQRIFSILLRKAG